MLSCFRVTLERGKEEIRFGVMEKVEESWEAGHSHSLAKEQAATTDGAAAPEPG